MKIADYVFETSWEICNKVGGIYTVLSTKAFTAVNHYKDNYICLGPDLSKEQNNDFIEDSSLFKNWRDFAGNEGLKFRIGRWNIAGSPIVILVDFTPFFEKKNEILTHFWLRYKLHCSVMQQGALSRAFTNSIAALMIKLLHISTNG